MLEGKQLRYLIGAKRLPVVGTDDIVEVDYDTDYPPFDSAIAYVNSRDEKNSGLYGPYLKTKDDIDGKYGEPRPDPEGLGWRRNLVQQFDRKKKFKYVEIDNPDSWDLPTNMRIYDLATSYTYGFRIIAKNPMLLFKRDGKDSIFLVSDPAVVGVIIEDGCGTPDEMQRLRFLAGKPSLPCWFVFYGEAAAEALQAREQILRGAYPNMGVTFSHSGEYGSSEDVLRPISKIAGETKMPAPQTDPLRQFAARLVAVAEKHGTPFDRGPGENNLVYAEGYDKTGQKIKRRVDHWDDVRCMIQFDSAGRPFFSGGPWEATTRAGYVYDRDRPLNEEGCAYIEPGYQKCWQKGKHRGKYWALVQTGGPVRFTRDRNKDFSRVGDKVYSDFIGINHHHGDDHDASSIGVESAGCNVVRLIRDHLDLMKLVDADPRQRANSAFVWGSTVLPQEWLDESATSAGATPATPAPSQPQRTPQPQERTFCALVPGGYYSSTPMVHDGRPVSIRMNNPGAVNGAKWEESYPGYKETVETTPGNRTTIFYAPEQGIGAYWDLLRRYRKLGKVTVRQIITQYGGSGQDYTTYWQQVSKWTHLKESTEIQIDGSDDATLLLFAKSMFRYEAGPWKPGVGLEVPWSDEQIMFGLRFGRELSSTGKPITGPVVNKSSSGETAAGGAVVGGGATTAVIAAGNSDVSIWFWIGCAVGISLLVVGVIAAIRAYKERRELA